MRAVWLAVSLLGMASVDNSKTNQIDKIFRKLVSERDPGAEVLVIKDGHTVFERGYGISDLTSQRRIDSHTNVRLASVTKQFTAMSIMLLVHDGKLRYDEPLTDVFPDFPGYGKTITIRHLLNHTSGLLDYEDIMARPYGGNLPETVPQIKDAGVLDLLKKESSTKFPASTQWSYSNSGYAVLAMIVEKVSGKPFGQFLHDRMLQPLKMNSTVAFEKGKNEVANRAFGHSRANGEWKQADQSPTSAVLGDGGIYSSLADLAKWDRALTQHTLLSSSEMQAALQAVDVPGVIGPDGNPATYGFGWFLDPYRGHKRMWHYGETVGFRTAIERFPDDALTVIVLCNRNDMVAQDLALEIADLFLNH
jgi:CubicO group peptidase (beta-lactamase class C family)